MWFTCLQTAIQVVTALYVCVITDHVTVDSLNNSAAAITTLCLKKHSWHFRL